MTQINKIKKDFHQKGLTRNQISVKYGHHWTTVDRAVKATTEDLLAKGKRPKRNKTISTPEVVEAIIDILDEEDRKNVPRKQRVKSPILFKILKEHGVFHGKPRTLRRILKQVRAKRGQSNKKSFLQLEFDFGHYLQVDHGPGLVKVKGQEVNGHLFVASVPGANLRFCQFYPNKSREFWGHFHELAFKFFGGIFPNVVYDNDSVLKISKTNSPTSFCLEMQSYYGFKAIFCNKAAGWEKGSVENAVGYCRRNFLHGIPEIENLEIFNGHLAKECQQDIQIRTEKASLGKLPKDLMEELGQKVLTLKRPKKWGIWQDLKVNNFQCISYLNHRYSLPEKYLGAKVRAHIQVFEVNIYFNNQLITTHFRKYLEGENSLILDHFLEQLLHKPRAFDHAAVVKRHKWDGPLKDLKRRLEFLWGQKDGNLHFIKILILKRNALEEEFSKALEKSIEINGISYPAFKSILRSFQLQQIKCPQEGILDENNFHLDKYKVLESKEFLSDRADVNRPEVIWRP